MNIYTAHLLFKLHDALTGQEFHVVKERFNKYLEDNQPQEANNFLVALTK